MRMTRRNTGESSDSASSTAGQAHMADESLLAALPPPEPYAVQVSNLTIAAPVPPWTLPLAIPITVPSFLQRRMTRDKLATVPKQLIRGVNLQVEAGEVLAIVGGSGSGKTTLLNAIACRLGNLEISSGAVSFIPIALRHPPSESDDLPTPTPTGQPTAMGNRGKLPKSYSLGRGKGANKIIGFVRQDDFLLPYLTVRETLTFSAELRLPNSVSKEMRKAIVEQTIAELGLAEAADTIVGGPFKKGISGGEKRRLSIGCILVTLPSVLVLDEPTTGLDSFTAFQLLESLSRLAQRGRAIIVSIHQPRSDAFGIFDKVTLLSAGSIVYSGPTTKILDHFRTQGYEPAAHTNPLDFVVDVSSIDTRNDAAEIVTRERVGALVKAWRERELELADGNGVWNEFCGNGGTGSGNATPRRAKADLERGIERIDSRSLKERGKARLGRGDASLVRPGFIRQTVLLTNRGLKNSLRNTGQNIGFFMQFVLIGVALGLAFYDPPETPGGIQTLKTIIYQSSPAAFYLSIIVYVFLMTKELVIFDREREDNLYSTVPYVIASWLSLLPSNMIFPTIYALIIYFMCGFWRHNLAVNVFNFIAQCILQQLGAYSYALLASSINRSFAQASLLANGFSIPFVLSSGYLIVHLPVWIGWTQWLSPYFYGFHWIARLQLIGRVFACDGVTGPARNQCDGTAVLIGLNFPLSTPLYVYPLGLLGFGLVAQMLATVVLQFYKPGGVKHASQQTSSKSASLPEHEVKESDTDGLIKKPLKGVEVVVKSLMLTVDKRNHFKRQSESKVILQNVDAVFPPGEVSVIMGPSGAGKSSLLQILAGRLDSGPMSNFRTSGSIEMNGSPFTEDMAKLVAFVEQEDSYHLPALTVRETLCYAARLRLRGKTRAECEARAEEVLRMLGLKLCANNIVGGELVKGISGGEKRRLSLAVQLISDPAVLFADEPLSGLDAYTARNVMQSLRDIASSGRTVVVSVHQPRSDIWQMFDNILLLVRGGRTAYSGPCVHILNTFERAGERCPPEFNPADFILDVVSVDHRSPLAEERSAKRVSKVVQLWQESFTPGNKELAGNAPLPEDTSMRHSTAPFLVAFPVILGRSFKNLLRSKDEFAARLANPPFMALLFWIFFARLKRGPSGAQDRVGLLQETAALPFVGMLSCVAIFPTEKALFFHEWKSTARQSVWTFILAYSVQEVIVSIVSSLLFSIVFVYGINLQHTGRIFVEFWFTTFALLSTGESVGVIFSSFFQNGGLAVSLVSAGLTLLAQLNGIISVTLPQWLEIVGWVSPLKPQCRVQLINEMNNLTFDCTDAQITSGACIATTGQQLLTTFGIEPNGTGECTFGYAENENFWLNRPSAIILGKYMGILLALILIFRLAGWAALRIKVASI